MKTADLMTREVAICLASDSLEDAARLMWERDVGCVVVTDAGRRPIGMITDRDTAMAAYIQGSRLREIRVEWAMSRKLVACFVDASLKDVESQMQLAQIRRVPLVDTYGALVGIITLADIARCSQVSALNIIELPGLARTLAEITARRSGDVGQAAV